MATLPTRTRLSDHVGASTGRSIRRFGRFLSRCAASLVLVICLTYSFDASAQIFDIDVYQGGSTFVEAEVGQPLTLSYVVTNSQNTVQALTDMVQADGGINAVYDANPYFLRPGERTARLVTVMIPRSVEAGIYEVNFLVRSSDGTLSAPALTSISIPAVVDFDVSPAGTSDVVQAGETFIARFRLENRGNTTITVDLDAEATDGLDAKPRQPSVSLRPASQQEIVVEVPIPEDWQRSQGVDVNLLTSIVDSGRRRIASARAQADILAQRGPRFEYHRYPMSVGVSTGLMDSPLGGTEPYIRTLAQGGGALREDGDLFLNFDIRTPSYTERVSSLTQRDRYVADLRHPKFGVMLGDLSAPSSSVAGGSIFGFGGMGRVDLRYFESDIYYAENRFSFAERRETGASFLFTPIDEIAAGVRVTDREDSYAPGSAVIFTGKLSPAAGITLDAEYGVGSSELDVSSRQPSAYSVKLNSVLPGLRAQGEYMRTDAFFPSSRSDQTLINALLSAQPADTWSLNGSYYFNRFGGLNLGSTNLTSYSHSGRFDVGFGGPNSMQFRSGYEMQGRVFAREERQSAWQHLGFIDATMQLGSVFLSAKPTAGVTRSNIGDSRFVIGGTITARTRFLQNRIGISASARHFEGPYGAFQVHESNARLSSASVSGSALVTENTSVIARFNGNFRRSGDFTSYGIRSQLDVVHQLPWKHSISVGGVISELSSNNRGTRNSFYEVAVTYRVPLRLPVHRSRNTGLVSGRLIDGNTGQGLANAAVMIGPSGTLTDEQGHFYAPFVPAGEQEPHLRSTDVPTSYVLKDPMRYDVRGGRTTEATLVAVPATTISGRVRVNGDRSIDDLADLPAIQAAGIMVRLYNADMEQIMITDSDGHFTFSGLPDGRFTVEIDESSIGDRFVIGDGTKEVHLRPGDVRTIDLTLRERRSVIQFQPLENGMPQIREEMEDESRPQTPIRQERENRGAQSEADRERVRYETHVVESGDTLFKLARAYYDGRWEEWQKIYDANQETIDDPENLEIGTVLRIPLPLR